MRTRSNILHSTLLCLTILFTACNKDNTSINSYKNCIEFSTETSTINIDSTKGAPITSISDITEFGIFAQYNETINNSNSFTANYMNNTHVTKYGDSFEYSPKTVWPNSGVLSFYGYLPYSSTENGIEISIQDGIAELTYNVPTDVTKQPDIMIANPQLNNDGSNPTVCLSFNHALAAVGFSAGGGTQNITKIAFKNIFNHGKTDITKGDLSWYDLKSSSTEYLAGIKDGCFTTSSQSETAINDNGYLMMIPQTLPSGATIVTEVDGIERSIDISGDKWEAGQIITYNYTPQEYWELEDFSSTDYPDSDTWVIVNEYKTGALSRADYAGLREAIVTVSTTSDREITIVFPYLTELPVSAIGSVYNSADFSCFKAIELPEVTYIQGYSLSYCKSLERVYLPKVTHTGIYAFSYSTSLYDVDMPIVSVLESRTFYGCSALTSIKLEYVEDVSMECFRGCPALQEIYLPSAETVEDYAFRSCKAISTLELATNSGKLLKEMSTTAFQYSTPTDITLKINGVGSSLLIDCNSLLNSSNNSTIYTFKEIEIN